MIQKGIFISHSHREPDESIANSMFDLFEKSGAQPKLDPKNISMNERLEQAIYNCDYFVVLLSERSLMDEMVVEEIKMVTKHTESKKMIFPVRLNLPVGINMNYDVAEYLRKIPDYSWTSERDTPVIVQEILQVMENARKIKKSGKIIKDREALKRFTEFPVPNAPLVVPGGNITVHKKFYIERRGERSFIDNVHNPGALMRIKGPRQFGKTSLLSKIIHNAKLRKYHTIPISFQQICLHQLKDLEKLLVQLCVIASKKMKIRNKIKEYWDDEFLDVKMKCTTYFEEYLLTQTNRPVLLAIDEADKLFEFEETSNEFFGMLRFWHEERNNNPVWNKFKLAISHSTEAYLAINSVHQSPFNVGIERELRQFTITEVNEFAKRHGLELTRKNIRRLMELIGGHPYLIHKALHALTNKQYTLDEFIEAAVRDDGPYSDHLRRHHWIISKEERYRYAIEEILTSKTCKDVHLYNKLRAAGLVKGTHPHIYISIKLYEIYFKKYFHNL